MKRDKYFKTFIITMLFLFGIIYLLGSFAMANFDIRSWDNVFIGVIAFCGGISIILAAAVADLFN